MAKSAEIKTTLSAEDKTKTSLKSAEKNFDNFGKSAQKSTKNIGKSFNNLNKNLQKTAKATQKTSATMSSFKGNVMAMAVTRVASGLKNTVFEYSNMSDALAKTSKQFGMSIESFQGLNHAAKIQGVSTQSLEGYLEKLQISMTTVKDSQSGLAKNLAKSNPELLKQLQSTKDTEKAFLFLAEAVDKEKNSSQKAFLTAQLLGRGGAEMTKMFDGGANAIKGFMQEQIDFGVVSLESAKQAEKFSDELTRIKASADGVKYTLMASLIPKLTALSQTITLFIKDNKTLIDSFTKITITLAPYVAKLMALFFGYKLLRGGILGSVDAVKSSMKAFRTAKTYLPTIIGFFKKLNIVQAINNALAMANPMGLIIAGIVVVVLLLIGVFVLLYKKCEGFRNMIKSIATAFKNAFMPTINFISGLIDGLVSKAKALAKWFGFGKNNKEESLEAPEPVDTPLSQQEQQSKLDKEHYENKSKTNIDVNFNNLPKGVVVNQGKPVIGVSLNLGYSGS